jgi:hypothetical protein
MVRGKPARTVGARLRLEVAGTRGDGSGDAVARASSGRGLRGEDTGIASAVTATPAWSDIL